MKNTNKNTNTNTTTMCGITNNQTNNKTIETMETIKIEWTVDRWLAVLPDGTKKTDVHLPSLIVAVANGDRDIARKIEIIF